MGEAWWAATALQGSVDMLVEASVDTIHGGLQPHFKDVLTCCWRQVQRRYTTALQGSVGGLMEASAEEIHVGLQPHFKEVLVC